LVFWKHDDDEWVEIPRNQAATISSASVRAVDPDETDEYWLTESGYTQPSCLYLCDGLDAKEKLKALPDMYDTSGLEVRGMCSASARAVVSLCCGAETHHAMTCSSSSSRAARHGYM
jgi:hypothetical protein